MYDKILGKVRENGAAAKQDKLVSGLNIKTINGQSVLGSGDLEVDGHFKGWFDTLDSLQEKHPDPTVGDYAYVHDPEPATDVSIWRCDVEGTWSNSGFDVDTSNVQTFQTGQQVNETPIDDTHLSNAKDGSLPKAEDVMRLKVKLEGVTARDVKVIPIVGTNVTTGQYVSGETGLPTTPSGSASAYAYFEIAIPQNTKSIRFLIGTKPSSYKLGYSVGYYDSENGNTYVPKRMFYFDNSSTAASTIEKTIKLQEGENVFMTTCSAPSTASFISLNNFYCYLQSGETIKDMIPIVVDDFTGGVNKALSAEKGKEIAQHISDLEQSEVVKYVEKTFATPEIGQTFSVANLVDATYNSVRVYDIEGGVDYYLYGAWQKTSSNYYLYIFTDKNDVVLSRILGTTIPISRESQTWLLWEGYCVKAPEGAAHLYEKCMKAAPDAYHHTDYYRYKEIIDVEDIDNLYEGGEEKVMGADAGKELYKNMATWDACSQIGEPMACTVAEVDGLVVGDNVEEAISVPPANPNSYLLKYGIDPTKSYHLKGNHLTRYGRWWLIWADVDGNFITKQYKSSSKTRKWDIVIQPSNIPEGARYLYVNVVRGGGRYNVVEEYVLVSIDEINNRINKAVGKRDFRILCIGDSFTQDAIEYMPFLFHKVNPNINLYVGLLYKGSTGITKVYEQYMYCKNEDADHNYGKNFNFYTCDGVGAWNEVTVEGDLYSVQDALDEDDWDVVTFGNTAAYDVDSTTESYAHQPHILAAYIALINEIALYVKHPIKIGALSVCNAISRTKTISGQDVRVNYKYDDNEGGNTYNASWPTIKQIYGWTMDDVKLVASETMASFVIPVWTAIMNAYTVDVIRAIGHYGDDVYTYNSSGKGYLRSDGRHLQEGLPCQIAAYTVVEALSRLLGTGHSILGDDTMFDSAYINQLNVPGKNGDPTGYPDGDGGRNIRFAQKCAIMANNNPFKQMDMIDWYNTDSF